MTENLRPSLDRFGRELEAAIRRDPERGANHAQARRAGQWVPAIALVAAAVVAVVLLWPGGRTQPAYALVRHVDGTVTVAVRSLSEAIAPLNRRFRALGIDETVLPVAGECRTATIFVTVPAAEHSDRLTFSTAQRLLLPGWHGIIAARVLSSGRVALALGAIRGRVPRCISAAPRGRVLGFRHVTGPAVAGVGGRPTRSTDPGPVKQARLLAIALVDAHRGDPSTATAQK